MRILFLGNNWVGWQVLHWLKEQREEVVGVVLHPPHKRTYGQEILASGPLNPGRIFDGSKLHEAETIDAIRTLQADIALSVLFDYLLRPEFIGLFPRGVINLHPAPLPYNRGQHPNIWSIIEGTPAGVTLHYIDDGIDTGDILAQQEVLVEPVDTGESLYRKLERVAVALFQKTWPQIKAGQVVRIPQDGQVATSHRTRDVEAIDEIDLNRAYRARDLLNLLRARTFPPYKGAYITVDGKRIYLRLQLTYEEKL